MRLSSQSKSEEALSKSFEFSMRLKGEVTLVESVATLLWKIDRFEACSR